jgi:hypothetical protein
LITGKYCEKDLPMARIWLRSWKNRGWKTRIGFDRLATSMRIINFSLRAPKSHKGISIPTPRPKRYGARGWKTADLVKFPLGTTEETVLNCGREV